MSNQAHSLYISFRLDYSICSKINTSTYWSSPIRRLYVLSLITFTMNFSGIILGLVSFICIGLFHPLVIKGEYYFGTRCWWAFAFTGVLMLITSLIVKNIYLSVIFGVISFSCFWSILELFEQEKRVKRGWFPKNPKKNYDTTTKEQ